MFAKGIAVFGNKTSGLGQAYEGGAILCGSFNHRQDGGQRFRCIAAGTILERCDAQNVGHRRSPLLVACGGL